MGSQKAALQKSTDTIKRNSATRDSSRAIREPFSQIQQIYRLQRALGNRAVTNLVNKKNDPSNNGIHHSPLAVSNFGLHSISCFHENKNSTIQEELQRTPEEEDSPVQGMLQRQREDGEEPVQASLKLETSDKDEKIQRAIQRSDKEEEKNIVQGMLQRQDKDEEEPVQASLQRETPEKDEKIQAAIQRSEKEDEKKPVQGKLQCKTDEEEPVQGKLQLKSSEEENVNTAIQPKLTVGKPDDIYEKEADSVADSVMTMPDQTVSLQSEKEDEKVKRTSLIQTLTPLVQRQEHDDKVQASFITIQRKNKSQSRSLDDETSSKISSSLGQGSSMPRETADFMESRFGADFSSVIIHTDSQAASVSKRINARAFTLGKDIYFGEGQYNTQTHDGKRLLAHELTHTIQQGASSARKAFPVLRTAPVIQRWSLKGLVNKATGYIPGFSLLCLLLGRNPVTDDKVERTPENIVKAIIGLIPVVGNALYNKLQETGAIQKTGAWLSTEISKLGITWEVIKNLFNRAWDRMGLLLGIDGNLKILEETFSPVIGRIVSFAGSVAGKIKEFVLEAALSIAGGAGKTVLGIINKGKAVFNKILDDPIGFVGNFLKAVGQGVQQFGKNFLNHFKGALFGWLFGSFAKEGINLPKSIDLPSIFGFVAEVLGLTYQAIRKRIVKALGPKGEQIISKIESAIDFVKDLITRGPIALWEKVKEFIGDLKSMIMTEVGKWVSTTIIGKAIEKIASMCNPVGALIQAAISIYNTIMFFVERWTQIKEFVDAIFNSINDIVMGNIGKAAGYIEKVMAKGLTLLISFLARLIGLGGIVGKIKDLIKKFAGMIEKALDKAIGWVVKKAKGLMGKLKMGAKRAAGKVKDGISSIIQWWKAKKAFKAKDGKQHTLFLKGNKKKAEFMIASSPMRVDAYLKKNRELLLTGGNSVVYEYALQLSNQIGKLVDQAEAIGNLESKSNKEKLRMINIEITQSMDKLSSIMIQLMGINNADMPNSAVWKYTPVFKDYPKKVSAQLITKETSKGGSSPNAENASWPYIQDNKLTDRWVRLHLVSEKLGGKGVAENLIPGPKTVNAAMENYSENPLKAALGKTKNNNVANLYSVLWVETSVDYYSNTTIHNNVKYHWANNIIVKGGFHFFDINKNKWVKNEKAIFKRDYKLPVPSTVNTKPKLNMNTATRAEMLELDFGKAGLERSNFKWAIDANYEIFIKHKNYKDVKDLEGKMKAGGYQLIYKGWQKTSLGFLINDLKKLEAKGIIVWS